MQASHSPETNNNSELFARSEPKAVKSLARMTYKASSCISSNFHTVWPTLRLPRLPSDNNMMYEDVLIIQPKLHLHSPRKDHVERIATRSSHGESDRFAIRSTHRCTLSSNSTNVSPNSDALPTHRKSRV